MKDKEDIMINLVENPCDVDNFSKVFISQWEQVFIDDGLIKILRSHWEKLIYVGIGLIVLKMEL